jgi:hypothetical protein
MNANTLDNLTFDQLVPTESKYLRKEDFDADGQILTIAGFRREDIKGDDGHLEEKIVLLFKELDKGMVLNKTNSQLIPVATGARNAGDAKGKQIVVFRDDSQIAEWPGRKVYCNPGEQVGARVVVTALVEPALELLEPQRAAG